MIWPSDERRSWNGNERDRRMGNLSGRTREFRTSVSQFGLLVTIRWEMKLILCDRTRARGRRGEEEKMRSRSSVDCRSQIVFIFKKKKKNERNEMLSCQWDSPLAFCVLCYTHSESESCWRPFVDRRALFNLCVLSLAMAVPSSDHLYTALFSFRCLNQAVRYFFSAVIKLRKTYIIYLRAGSRSGSVVHLLTLELIFSGDKWTYRFHKYFVISGLLRNERLTFSTQGPDPGPWLKWVLCGASGRKMRFFFISQLVIRTVGEKIYHIATADFKS